MNKRDKNLCGYNSLLLLDEISRNGGLTQRDLSKKLGVALGLINSYIRNLASKGCITISTIPRNRYRYYLTPIGMVEKTHLTYRHLQNFTSLYKVARDDFSAFFRGVAEKGPRRIFFCGMDEVAEIAYLSLKEAGLELSGIVDDAGAGKKFFGHEVGPVAGLADADCDMVLITSFSGGAAFRERLSRAGVCGEKVCDISAGGWLKKIEG